MTRFISGGLGSNEECSVVKSPKFERLRTSRGSKSVPGSDVQVVMMFSGVAMMVA